MSIITHDQHSSGPFFAFAGAKARSNAALSFVSSMFNNSRILYCANFEALAEFPSHQHESAKLHAHSSATSSTFLITPFTQPAPRPIHLISIVRRRTRAYFPLGQHNRQPAEICDFCIIFKGTSFRTSKIGCKIVNLDLYRILPLSALVAAI